MKDALDRILRILDKQIKDLEAKSEATRLDEKEIDALGSLARTYIHVRQHNTKRGRPQKSYYTKGKFMTDDQLVDRATDEDEQK